MEKRLNLSKESVRIIGESRYQKMQDLKHRPNRPIRLDLNLIVTQGTGAQAEIAIQEIIESGYAWISTPEQPEGFSSGDWIRALQARIEMDPLTMSDASFSRRERELLLGPDEIES